MLRVSALARWIAFAGVVATSLALVALLARPASGDYQGPDENTSQAFGPLAGDSTYSATLNQDGSHPDDQDWFFYYVPKAGDKLHWTVTNKNAVTACPPYQCNVYATLEDSNGKQVGGPNSSAGTPGAPPGQTQTIDWTFQSPGKYYIAFIGDGPKIAYQFSVTPASGVSSTPPRTGGGGTGTPALSLHAHQAGRSVDFSLTVPAGGGKLDARLYLRSGVKSSLAGSLHRAQVSAGKPHFALTLSKQAWAKLGQHHPLRFILRVTLTRANDSKLQASKTLVLRRP